jgi:hypothetical protein
MYEKSTYKIYQKLRVTNWNRVADKYDNKQGFTSYYHKRLEEVLRFVIPPGQRVIEIG